MDLRISQTEQQNINLNLAKEVKMSKFSTYETDNHPAIIVESSSMAGIELPPLTYQNKLPEICFIPDSYGETPISDIQEQAINYAGMRHEVRLVDGSRAGFLIGDGTGLGKGRSQPLNALLTTPTGQIKMKDVKIGTKIISVDGTVTKITGVFPQGKIDVYKVTFSDGTFTECSGDHLWETQTRRQRHYEKKDWGVNYSKPKVLTTSEILRTIRLIHTIPLTKPVEFKKQEITIDPYLLGILLAEGYLREKGSVEITNADEQILDEIRNLIHPTLELKAKPNHKYHYNVVKKNKLWKGQPRKNNKLVNSLRDYKLTGKTAPYKFIPKQYKINTPEVRIALLQGLMDCDGYISSTGSSMYYTVSKQLADDVIFLVQSLGGVATRGIKKTTHLDCHVIYIKLPEGIKPFRLLRKLERVKKTWTKYPPQRYIKSIELIGKKECQCIAIDHPRHLYLTNDFIVTHNTIAGVIYDNYIQGLKKSVWISASQDLIVDALRDFEDIHFKTPLIRLNDYKIHDKITAKEGTIFCTYSTLIQKKKDNLKISRLQQLIDWLGDDSIIIFDECHKLKNFFAGGLKQPTQTGIAGVELQKQLPNAKVFYSSATGATDVQNLGYMERLGLWGAGTSFPEGFSQFLQEIDGGGIGAMEMVARDMKALGMYMSRNLSYEGVEYTEALHTLTPEQTEIYNNVAGLWKDILNAFEDALKITNGGGAQKKLALQSFWSNNQRFWNQLITALKIPTAVKVIEDCIAKDKSVVISIINTLESRTSEKVAQVISEMRDLEDVDFTPREVIVNLLEKCFPTQQFEEIEGDNGSTIKVPAMENGEEIHSRVAMQMKEDLLNRISDFSLPDNPLDQIINYFGSSKVAEITGRKRRLVKNEQTGKVEYKRRNPEGVSMNKTNVWEMKQFQDGKKHIAIISDAGACGISLHSDNGALNTQKRVQMTLQVGWSADKQMQTFGRTHRTNQAHPPEYVMTITNIGGEKRFASTIAKRLASLGALTKGQADATDGSLSQYNFETKEGTAALMKLYKGIETGKINIEGINAYDTLSDMRIIQELDGIKKEDYTNIPKFLNRILTIDLNRQNKIFDKFCDIFQELVLKAKAEGTFDEGVTDLRAESIRLVKTETLSEDHLTGAKTEYYKLEQDIKTTPTPFSKVQAIAKIVTNNRLQGYFINSRSKNICFIYEIEGKTDVITGQLTRRFVKQTPRAKESATLDEINNNYYEVTENEAEAHWIKAFNNTPPVTVQEVHIIGGVILPLWYKLKKSDATDEDKMRIVRTTTDDNHRIVGIQIPPRKIKDIVLNFETKSISTMDFNEVLTRVLLYGESVKFPGNSSMELRKIKKYGQSRIELAGAKSNMSEVFQKIGLEYEREYGLLRFYFSTNQEQAEETYKELLKIYVPNINSKKAEPKPTVESRTTQLSDLTKSRSAQLPEIIEQPETPTHNTPSVITDQFSLFS